MLSWLGFRIINFSRVFTCALKVSATVHLCISHSWCTSPLIYPSNCLFTYNITPFKSSVLFPYLESQVLNHIFRMVFESLLVHRCVKPDRKLLSSFYYSPTHSTINDSTYKMPLGIIQILSANRNCRHKTRSVKAFTKDKREVMLVIFLPVYGLHKILYTNGCLSWTYCAFSCTTWYWRQMQF